VGRTVFRSEPSQFTRDSPRREDYLGVDLDDDGFGQPGAATARHEAAFDASGPCREDSVSVRFSSIFPRTRLSRTLALFAIAVSLGAAEPESGETPSSALASSPLSSPPLLPILPPLPSALVTEFVENWCVDCHDAGTPKGKLALDALATAPIAANTRDWERVVRRLERRQMPPADRERPGEETYEAALAELTSELDRSAAESPDPGRSPTFRRLTRSEYRSAIRDLLALEIDAAALLPPDESVHGFESGSGGELSPTALERYVSAAQRISRLALGHVRSGDGADLIVHRVRPDLTQDVHIEGLPLGTRGGALFRHEFAVSGDYELRVRLARDRDEFVEGSREPHEVQILIDRELVQSWTVTPPRRPSDHESADAHLVARIAIDAGLRELGVTFVERSTALLETRRQPYNAHFNRHRHPRLGPAIYQFSIAGPFAATEPGDTASRSRIFGADAVIPLAPNSGPGRGVSVAPPPRDELEAEVERARRILARLARRAYRRPIDAADIDRPLALFREARTADVGGTAGFENGLELALAGLLASPHFLFRIERDPEGLAPGMAYRVSDFELASRLSFFIQGSPPDDALLDAAERGELRAAGGLERQVSRLLADPRSQSLASGFAGQWLGLRGLGTITPDARLFPDFDENLRRSMRRETELLFESIVREDRSLLELIRPAWTYLDERLARHYGVPGVIGSRFRKVPLDGVRGTPIERGGILRHGSILTVTSFATRTSPVLRGKWLLETLLGTPPPPPPPNVPALDDGFVSASLPVRERLEAHRANPACAGCHQLIDAPGLALEGFDPVGRSRSLEAGRPIDTRGGLPDGSGVDGVTELEDRLLRRPDVLAATLTEKLLSYALGRAIEPSDAPAVRGIVRRARADGYRFSSIIRAIVSSPPFQMRTVAER
jgi:hypothetical protein